MSNRKIDYEMADYFRSIVDKSGLSQEEWATRLGVTPARSPIIAPAKERRRPKDFCCFKKLPRVFEKTASLRVNGPTGMLFFEPTVHSALLFYVR